MYGLTEFPFASVRGYGRQVLLTTWRVWACHSANSSSSVHGGLPSYSRRRFRMTRSSSAHRSISTCSELFGFSVAGGGAGGGARSPAGPNVFPPNRIISSDAFSCTFGSLWATRLSRTVCTRRPDASSRCLWMSATKRSQSARNRTVQLRQVCSRRCSLSPTCRQDRPQARSSAAWASRVLVFWAMARPPSRERWLRGDVTGAAPRGGRAGRRGAAGPPPVRISEGVGLLADSGRFSEIWAADSFHCRGAQRGPCSHRALLLFARLKRNAPK